MTPHTTTGEWQSFELRMRRRRVERLVLRADAATDAGCFEEAREALAEARRLEPAWPDLERIEQRLRHTDLPPTGGSHAVVAVAAAAAPARLTTDEPRVASAFPGPSKVEGRRKASAAAALGLLAAGSAFAYYALAPRDTLEPTQEFHQLAPVVDAPLPQPIAPPEPAPATDPQPVSTTGSVETPDAAALDAVRAPAATPASDLPATPGDENTPPAPRAATPVPDRSDVRAPFDPPEPPAPRVSGAPGTNLPTAPPPTLPTAPASPIDSPASAVPASPLPPADPALTQAAVRTTLDRYAAAYSQLDADAAHHVYPGVNRDALARAFDSLASQRVSLGTCSIDLTGARARARCAGSTTWRPKVGNAAARTDARTWTFELAKAGADWTIVSAQVQNR